MISCYTISYNPTLEWLRKAEASTNFVDEKITVDDHSMYQFRCDYRNSYNQGLGEARNTAIRLTKGDIICTIDDDDEWLPEGVEKMLEFIEKNPQYDVWFSPCELFGESTGKWGHWDISNLQNANCIPNGAFFKRKIWEKYPYPDIRAGEDWAFWLKAYRVGYKFGYLDVPTYRHRVRKDSMSANWTGGKLEEIRNTVNKLCEL